MKTKEQKAPPHDEHAEADLIGELLIGNKYWDEVASIVEPGDFYSPRNAKIFKAMANLAMEHQPFDLVTVADQLPVNEKLGNDTWRMILVKYTEDIYTAVNCIAHAKIIKDKSMLRKIQVIASSAYEQASNEVDSDELLNILQGRIRKLATGAEDEAQSLPDLVHLVGQSSKGLKTGFSELDEKFILENGSFNLIAGRPGMGKTALALKIADYIARSQCWVTFYSLEMNKLQLIQRLGAMAEHINVQDIRHNRLTNQQLEQLKSGEYLTSRMLISDRNEWTAESIARDIRLQVVRNDVGLVVIDYLGLVRAPGFGDNENLGIGSITRELKNTAKDCNIPIVMLQQLNRLLENREDKRPRLGDLRGSGSLEQDADAVLFVYRPASYGLTKGTIPGRGRYSKGEDVLYDPDYAEIIIAKQRQGPTGIVEAYWNKDYMLFTQDALVKEEDVQNEMF